MVVRVFDGFLVRLVRENTEDGRKHLFAIDAHVFCNAREEDRLDHVAFDPVLAGDDLGALAESVIHGALDALSTRLCEESTQSRAIMRALGGSSRVLVGEEGEELVGDRFVHNGSLCSHADLTRVEQAAKLDRFCGTASRGATRRSERHFAESHPSSAGLTARTGYSTVFQHFHSQFKVGVFGDDSWGFATKFEDDRLQVLSTRLRDDGTDSGRSGEAAQ